MIYPARHIDERDSAVERSLIKFLTSHVSVLWKHWPMDMSCRMLGGGGFTLTGICPHCHSKAVFLSVTSSHEEGSEYIWHQELYAGMQCQGCGGFILGCVVKNDEHGTWEYRLHYPLGTPDDTVADEIPPHIASDFSEALRCLWVKAYRATVAMCARALQTSCDEKEAKGGTLNKQIDDLGSKGVITEPLRQWAHQVRLTRNRELQQAKKKRMKKAKTAA